MGCISSKLLTRSLSTFQDELNHSISRRSNNNANGSGIPVLIYSNSYTNKESIKTWELISSPKGDRLSPSLDSEESKQNGFDCVGATRSRSIHTVEEYEEMVNSILLSKEKNDSILSSEKDSIDEIQGEDISIDKEEIIETEKGSKRKAMSKELTSLSIPCTVEFPTVASLREWLHVMTPKFGSYTQPATSRGKSRFDDPEGCIFSSELLASFEECMQQLEEDEEIILREMEDKVEEGGSEFMELAEESRLEHDSQAKFQ